MLPYCMYLFVGLCVIYKYIMVFQLTMLVYWIHRLRWNPETLEMLVLVALEVLDLFLLKVRNFKFVICWIHNAYVLEIGCTCLGLFHHPDKFIWLCKIIVLTVTLPSLQIVQNDLLCHLGNYFYDILLMHNCALQEDFPNLIHHLNLAKTIFRLQFQSFDNSLG